MSSKHKHLIVAITITMLVAVTGFSLYFAYANRILPLVMVEGVSLNHKTPAQAQALLAKKLALPTQLALEIGGKKTIIETDTLVTDTGIIKAVQLAYDAGRLTNWPARITLPMALNEQYLNGIIANIDPLLLHPVEEPSLSFANDGFTITDGKPGTVIDLDALTISITAIARTHANAKPLVLTMRTVLPTTQPSQYAPLIPRATTIVNTRVALTVDNRTITVEPKTKASWLTAQVALGSKTAQLYLKRDEVKAYAASLAKKYNRAALPREIDPDGNEVRAGIDGKKLDEQKLVIDITNIIGATQAGPIALAFDSTPAGEKRLGRAYTPGRYPGKYIEVSLKNQKLYQIEGDHLVAEHAVSTGKWSMPTPQGTFSINDKTPRAHSAKYNLDMPWWMDFFGGKYGIHELPEFADGRKEGAAHIGTPVSHGCIRLAVGDAKEVYDWADIGTPVVIEG